MLARNKVEEMNKFVARRTFGRLNVLDAIGAARGVVVCGIKSW